LFFSLGVPCILPVYFGLRPFAPFLIYFTYQKKKVERCTFIIFDFFPRLFSVLVKEAFVPSIWVPPSTVRMLLAYPSIVSEYASEHLVQNKKN